MSINGINWILSINKLSNINFFKYIEMTNTLCLYKLGNEYISNNIHFPNTKSLTLINCSIDGINNILNPTIFPNLKEINYLSTSINNTSLHKRFSKDVMWVFPDKNYEYYNFMVKYGYGKKDPDIIKKYIANKKIVDGKNRFDISYELDLYIPGYGIVNGEWWNSQFQDYLIRKKHIYKNIDEANYDTNDKNIVFSNFKQETEEFRIEKELVEQQLIEYQFDDINTEYK